MSSTPNVQNVLDKNWKIFNEHRCSFIIWRLKRNFYVQAFRNGCVWCLKMSAGRRWRRTPWVDLSDFSTANLHWKLFAPGRRSFKETISVTGGGRYCWARPLKTFQSDSLLFTVVSLCVYAVSCTHIDSSCIKIHLNITTDWCSIMLGLLFQKSCIYSTIGIIWGKCTFICSVLRRQRENQTTQNLFCTYTVPITKEI